MELKAILFDLDNTLLKYIGGSNLFMEKALRSLFDHVAQFTTSGNLVSALEEAWGKLDANAGSSFTNEEIYLHSLSNNLGLETSKLKKIFEDFYREVMSEMQSMTSPMPFARSVVDWTFQHGLDAVIATGIHGLPMVHDMRLDWAGVPVSDYDYKLVTSMSNMHASKPYGAYYKEVLNYIDQKAENCLMIGDMWDDDIVPATSIGIHGYWFTETKTDPPESIELLMGYGDLGDFLEYLRSLDR
jgi:putative hydrolase of the HAD superfamily